MDGGLYNYTKTELDKLLKTIVILIDTREKENKHITKYFDSKKIPYTSLGLESADYSVMIPKNESFGILRDLYFHKHIAIERKNSIDEIANNLSNDRDRFEDELLRSKAQIIIMIEDGSLDEIFNHNYRSSFNEKAFIGSLLSYQIRYNAKTSFITKDNAGKFIYMTMYYYIREYLRNGGVFRWVKS